MGISWNHLSKILGGWTGLQKPKVLKESVKLKLNFQRSGGGGGELKPKKASVAGY